MIKRLQRCLAMGYSCNKGIITDEILRICEESNPLSTANGMGRRSSRDAGRNDLVKCEVAVHTLVKGHIEVEDFTRFAEFGHDFNNWQMILIRQVGKPRR